MHTTATSLGDAPFVALAASQHKDYKEASMELSHVVPSSVLTMVADEGLVADASVLKAVNWELDANWRS